MDGSSTPRERANAQSQWPWLKMNANVFTVTNNRHHVAIALFSDEAHDLHGVNYVGAFRNDSFHIRFNRMRIPKLKKGKPAPPETRGD
jgi:hypothetical protein